MAVRKKPDHAANAVGAGLLLISAVAAVFLIVVVSTSSPPVNSVSADQSAVAKEPPQEAPQQEAGDATASEAEPGDAEKQPADAPIQYDAQKARENQQAMQESDAAELNTRTCMYESSKLYLRMGARDRNTITTLAVKTCGYQMTQFMRKANEPDDHINAYLKILAGQALDQAVQEGQ
jgi:uncharacterized membrane protein YhiD involved in acid resistance